MTLFDTTAILLAMAAFFGFINHRYFRLPSTIGLLLGGLLASAGVLALDALFPQFGLGADIRQTLQQIDFPQFLMHGMLGFLLFAGALHVNFDDLLENKWPILILATVGVVISTVAIGWGSYWVFHLLGFPIPLSTCLVFGALISPTDPIAVLGIMKSVGAPKSLEIKVAGESLLNDGVGVVVFSVLLAAAGGSVHGGGPDAISIGAVFIREVFGGIVLGLGAGLLVYQAMKRIDEPNLEVLLSGALVTGIIFIAFQFHLSAPLGCVVAGLFIGNHGRHFAMTKSTRQALDSVWSFADYSMNAVLFLLLGLEIVLFSFSGKHLLSMIVMIPLVLCARFSSVSIPVSLLKLSHEFTPGAIKILTWGGLRGGISVALALSLPDLVGRDAVLSATYGIVIFSILVQGMTMGPLIRRLVPKET